MPTWNLPRGTSTAASVEEIAKRCSLTQDEVATKAIQLAEAAYSKQHNDRKAHVGYYIIDKGRATLERAAG